MGRSLLIGLLLSGCSEYEYSEVTVSETFVQEDVELVADVLFVVDDSASMSEEQSQLAVNFASFMGLLGASTADFQLGVISMSVDGDDAGLLRGGTYTAATPDLATTAANAFRVGTHGNRVEHGLEAAALALDGRNPGFLRDGAELDIVVLSDEDDQSPGRVEDWLGLYEDAVGRRNTHFHAIVGDLPAGCASLTSAADPGPRYIAASVNTDGFRESICSADYGEALAHSGLDLAGVRDTFVLADYPDPETLTVTVDDAVVEAWSYAPGLNAVVFAADAVPAPGSRITIAYRRIAETEAPA